MPKAYLILFLTCISVYIFSDVEDLFEKDQETSGKRVKIAEKIIGFYKKNKKLPEDLKELQHENGNANKIQYVIHNKRQFSVCAEFHTNYLEIMKKKAPKGSCWMTASWYHFEKGNHCIQYNIMKDSSLRFVNNYLIS